MTQTDNGSLWAIFLMEEVMIWETPTGSMIKVLISEPDSRSELKVINISSEDGLSILSEKQTSTFDMFQPSRKLPSKGIQNFSLSNARREIVKLFVSRKMSRWFNNQHVRVQSSRHFNEISSLNWSDLIILKMTQSTDPTLGVLQPISYDTRSSSKSYTISCVSLSLETWIG